MKGLSPSNEDINKPVMIISKRYSFDTRYERAFSLKLDDDDYLPGFQMVNNLEFYIDNYID
jgi:hypothetical protein